MKCGLLGRTLGHSYSPAIHAQLGDYEYALYEKEPEELEDFLLHGDFTGMNVTIPYKKAVVAYCAELSAKARALGSVNTLLRRADGTLYGDNTDYDGFSSMVRLSGVNVQGKKALVLGSGGASVTVCAVLRSLGAEVVVISRHGEYNYVNLNLQADAAIIANTTPVGMYPHNGVSPLDLKAFPACAVVFDIVYTPERTALMLQAESLGIPAYGGLHMLVGQAKRAREIWQDKPIPDSETTRIEALLRRATRNIALIGMPGCGKSTVADALGKALGREVCDSDARIVELAGMSIPEIFATQGEDAFRAYETQAIAELSKRSGIILATGGGCVTRAENYPLLHQNSTILWLQRDISALPTDGRPLSQTGKLQAMYDLRRPLYEHFADAIIDNNGSVEDTLAAIKEVIG